MQAVPPAPAPAPPTPCCCRPLPVLTLDEFVLLAKVLQRAMAANPELEAALTNFRKDFGFNWWALCMTVRALPPACRQAGGVLCSCGAGPMGPRCGVLPRHAPPRCQAPFHASSTRHPPDTSACAAAAAVHAASRFRSLPLHLHSALPAPSS